MVTRVSNFVWLPYVAACGFMLMLSACGGGSGGTNPPSVSSAGAMSSSSLAISSSSVANISSTSSLNVSSASSTSSAAQSSSSTSSLTNSDRINAATQTVQTNNYCVAISPFYWEIGDYSAALAFGSVGGTTYNANTDMPIASASKWVFGAYVAQLRAGQLSADDISALTMSSGYTNFDESSCIRLLQPIQDAETVNQCFQSDNSNGGKNSDYQANNLNHFYYNGGHFQNLAVNLGLGSLNNANLQAAVQAQLGTDFSFTYGTPQLAGGVNTTAANYAIFLRKILNNQLAIHDLLGQHKVCTQLASCPTAVYTPAPANESWSYSLGHWVESDPLVGDGAFSSAGAFGFYPWIDKTKTYYGVLARKAAPGSGFESASCGRLIRKAWVTGVAQ